VVVAAVGELNRKGSAGGRPVGFDPARYARRNTIERGFCQLKLRFPRDRGGISYKG
jgi:hypothetical protein